MKKFFLSGVILIIFLLFLVTTSGAITIGFDPISQTVPVGDTAEIALVISGLGAPGPSDFGVPSISEFDLNIGFDPNILNFTGATFGDPILGDQLDIFALGGNPMDAFEVSPGLLNIFEVSLDFPFDLEDFQADAFTLATLEFDTLAVGTSQLDISIITLADAFGDPLDASLESGSISPVPEPATILLLLSGMAGMGVFGRKKFRSSNASTG